jgi:LPS O-antigen subunit length determinant protein (WzzB/FepE family)
MKTISFDHKDPAFAVELVQKVYQAADEELKSDTLIRTRKYIAYLEKRLATVTVAEYREALSDLLVDQERTQMVIEADLPFAAKIVSDAVVPDTPDKPKIVVTLIVMTLIGVFLGVLWIFLLENEEGSKQG